MCKSSKAWKKPPLGKRLDQPGNKGLVEPAAVSATGCLLLRCVRQESFFLAVDYVLASVEVGLVGTNHLGLLDEFVAEDADKVNRDTLQYEISKRVFVFSVSTTYKISSDEVLVIKAAVAAPGEDGEILGQGDQNAEEQGNVRSNETKRRSVSHLVFGDTLSPACANEPDVGYQERDPGQESEDGGQVDKVAEDSLGVVCNVHKSSAAEEC